MQHNQLALPDDLTGGGGHGLQGFNGGLGLALLQNTQHGVQQHHCQNDNDLGHLIFPSQQVGGSGNGSGNQQNNQHGILQLGDEALHHGRLLGFLQFVVTVLLQTLLCLSGVQALRPHIQFLQDILSGPAIEFLHFGFRSFFHFR